MTPPNDASQNNLQNNTNQNVIMASVDTIDLENFNKSLFKEVNNIAQDNLDQE